MNFLIEKRDFSGAMIDTVNARTLHANLEVGRDYTTWIKDRIEQYDFKEGIDYVVLPEIGEQTYQGVRTRIENIHVMAALTRWRGAST